MKKTQLKLDEIWLYSRTSSSRVSHRRSEAAAALDQDSDAILILEPTSNPVKQAKENLITASIFLCRQDIAFDGIMPLFRLFETLGIRTLPMEASAIQHTNNEAVICGLEHVAQCLHAELIEKVKASSVVGWILNAARSKTGDRVYLVYVRYLENLETKTSYYGLFDLRRTAPAKDIAIGLTNLWTKDNLKPSHSCWLATDNLSLVTDVNEEIIIELRRYLGTNALESSLCVGYPFALIDTDALYGRTATIHPDPVRYDLISKLESLIGKIYDYFGKSPARPAGMKSWQKFWDMAELQSETISDVRWCSIRGAIEPIIQNIQPGSQALLEDLQETMSDSNSEYVSEFLDSILDDQFLIPLHLYHDLHQLFFEPIREILEDNQQSYLEMMRAITAQRRLLHWWNFRRPKSLGPALSNYLQLTENQTFGDFKIKFGDRERLLKDCGEHVLRLSRVLMKRWMPSINQVNLYSLFDENHLIEHKTDIHWSSYGRSTLEVLRHKYKDWQNFNPLTVMYEWDALKVSLENSTHDYPGNQFWKKIIVEQRLPSLPGDKRFKHIFRLLDAYLISSPYEAECERGFSTFNRIQTVSTLRTFDTIMTIRMLLKDNVKSSRYQTVIDKACASWNDQDYLYQIQLMTGEVRPGVKRSLSLTHVETTNSKPKKPKARAIACANGCETEVPRDDPAQKDAIRCSHQAELYDWIDPKWNCSRRLCNGCRIKLNLSTTSIWFCSDHASYHTDDDENEEEYSSSDE